MLVPKKITSCMKGQSPQKGPLITLGGLEQVWHGIVAQSNDHTLLRWYLSFMLWVIDYDFYKCWTDNSYWTKSDVLKPTTLPYQEGRTSSTKHPLSCSIPLQNLCFATISLSFLSWGENFWRQFYHVFFHHILVMPFLVS